VIPRVVFDTSVLLSSIGWRGKPLEAVDLARQGLVSGLTCTHILNEVAEKLTTKLNQPSDVIDEKIAELLTFLQVIEISGMLRVVKDDPQDDAIVESAVVGEAQYIVTGDKRHLLPLGSFQGILIITPARLLELIPRA
jgi:putative PIN family toxin of toxin-antitoxin system